MHRIRIVTILIGIGALAGAAQAITVPTSDPSYVPQTDMVTFNWRVLNITSGGAVPIPHLPTGNNVDPFIRVYSNGNTNSTLVPPVKWQDDKVGGPFGDFNAAQSAALWYGLEYEKGRGQNPDTVGRALTTDEVLARIQAIDPGSVSPIFALDQNQENNDNLNDPLPAGWPVSGAPPALHRDIWIKGRLILVSPAALGPAGLAELNGKTAAEVNGIVDPLVAAGDPNQAVVFVLADDLFLDFPPDWSHLPGIFEPVELLSGDPILDPVTGLPISVDNNGDAARGDWGGFVPTLDLTAYPGWAFLLEVQTVFDNDGQEEIYIVGGFGFDQPPPVIPEPMTALSVGLMLTVCGPYVRRRLRAG